ncbi:hypothetical protein L1887_32190 [Cichorium endivia]|nr:hypothetical protein L1887_32190 [Cichorium endivia]
MRFTPIAIPALDEVPAVFCAQIPEGMLSKVSDDCIEVNTYRATLVIPYPIRDFTHEETQVTTKAQTRVKGKKKAAGGPSAPKKGERKRKASDQATPKKKQQKKSRKLAIRDESSESEKQTSDANPEAEEEEHQSSPIHEARPPTPPHFKIPPSPPKTTRPPTPPPPPTTAQQTPPIHTTSSEVPPPSPPKTSSTPVPPITSASDTFLNIPSSGPDTSLPDFPFQEDFDFEASTFTPQPSPSPHPRKKPWLSSTWHQLPSKKLMKKSNTGFDPTKKPEASVEEMIGEVQKSLIQKMEELLKASEQRVLEKQKELQQVVEGKLKSAVELIDEKHQLLKEQTDKQMEELLKKLELSNSEVTKELHGLRSSTESFNSQYQTGFAKHLSDAHKRVEELTAELSSSAITTFSKELRTTNQTLVSDMVDKLKTVLQPMLKLSMKMDKSQTERLRPQLTAQGEHDVHPSQGGESEAPGSRAGETTTSEAGETPTSKAIKTTTTTTTQQQQRTILGRPPFIPPIPSKANPTFGTTMTTKAGGSSSQPLRKEIRIAPHMEQTEDLIKSIGFNDFHINNRLPLKSLETKTNKNQQLDLPYNPKTFAFLQFERNVAREKLPEFKARKVAFHAKFIQAPNYVWSEKKIVKIISIKRGEEFVGFQNLNFFVLRGKDEEKSRFTISDFPIMNPSDFITLLS